MSDIKETLLKQALLNFICSIYKGFGFEYQNESEKEIEELAEIIMGVIRTT